MGQTARLAWRRRARPLLGTLVEVSIRCYSDEEFIRWSDLAFVCVSRFHIAMSFHEATSDVRRIASAGPGITLQLAPETWGVIAAAQAFELESAGVFNVATAAQLVARGCLPSPSPSPSNRQSSVPSGTSARDCLKLEAGSRVTVRRPVWVDLGGIAKGAAVDAALAVIRSAGAAAAVVNAGGDMALFGAQVQPITVLGPGGVHVHAGDLADGAIASSGPFGHGACSNLVLRPGQQARWAGRTVSVVAPTCQVADALTKVLAALGPEAAPLLARHAAEGFSVDEAGHLERVQ